MRSNKKQDNQHIALFRAAIQWNDSHSLSSSRNLTTFLPFSLSVDTLQRPFSLCGHLTTSFLSLWTPYNVLSLSSCRHFTTFPSLSTSCDTSLPLVIIYLSPTTD
jgi:hypothetical protein